MPDIIGCILFASIGVWLVAAPQSVIGFYKRFDRSKRFVLPKPAGIRIAGLLWIVLVVAVTVLSRPGL